MIILRNTQNFLTNVTFIYSPIPLGKIMLFESCESPLNKAFLAMIFKVYAARDPQILKVMTV